MHKIVSKKNQELSIVQAIDNFFLTETERFKFYNQCKKTIREKIDVVNLGMLVFSIVCPRKNNTYNFSSRFYENCESFIKCK